VVMKGWLGQPLEGRLEQLRTGAILPSLDEQYRFGTSERSAVSAATA